jgi:hypothetical protein
MTGAEWVADKLNSDSESQGISATVESADVVFVQRQKKPSAYVGVVPTKRGEATPLIGLDEAQSVAAQQSEMAMIIAIPRGARWSGATMRRLQSDGIAFGGVGDLLSALGHDNDISTHRNKTFAFVNDGLLRHSRVASLDWVESKKVRIRLRNDATVTVALEDAYDLTMSVARDAARTFGAFDVLLKTNPNGSITSNGAASVEQLGFQSLKWGELFGYLAKRGGQASYDDLTAALRGTRSPF